jgi:hypothetical protein
VCPFHREAYSGFGKTLRMTNRGHTS